MKYTIELYGEIEIAGGPKSCEEAVALFENQFSHPGKALYLQNSVAEVDANKDKAGPKFYISVDCGFEFESEATDTSKATADFFEDLSYPGVPLSWDYNVKSVEEHKA